MGYLEALALAGDKPLDIELAENLVVAAFERLKQGVTTNEQPVLDGSENSMNRATSLS